MKKLMKLVLAVGLGLGMVLTSATSALQDAPAAEEATFPATASCLLKIRSDPRILPMEPRMLDYLLNSSGVAGETSAELLREKGYTCKIMFRPLSVGSETLGLAPAEGGGFGYGAAAPPVAGFGMGGSGLGGYGGGGTLGAAPPSAEPPSAGVAFAAGGPPRAVGGGGMMSVAGMAANVGSAGGGHVLIGRLEIGLEVPEPELARKIMADVTQRLQKVLAQAHEAESKQLSEMQDVAAREVDEAHAKLEALHVRRLELTSKSGMSDLSREAILALSARIETERQDVALKTESQRAREAALQKQIKQIAEEGKQSTADHPAVKAYQSRLDAARQQMERVKQLVAAGTATQAEQQAAQANAALIEAEVAMRLEELAESRGGKRLAALNDQLAALSVDVAEAQVRLKSLDERSAQVRKLLELADEYELQVGIELPIARARYESARYREQELKTWMRALRAPSVTVIGG